MEDLQDYGYETVPELVRTQKWAKAIVMESSKVKSVRWELDKNWFSQHGA